MELREAAPLLNGGATTDKIKADGDERLVRISEIIYTEDTRTLEPNRLVAALLTSLEILACSGGNANMRSPQTAVLLYTTPVKLLR
jgi:hypothetical protein